MPAGLPALLDRATPTSSEYDLRNPPGRSAVSHKAGEVARIEALEATLRDVLAHIRPQGHPKWELNTCLVTNAQVATWWAALGVTPTWEAEAERSR